MWAQGVQHPCLFSLPSPPPLLSSLSPTLKTVSGTKQVNDLFKIKIITVYFSLSLNIVITGFDTAWWVEKVAICGFLKKIWEEGRELFHPSIHSLLIPAMPWPEIEPVTLLVYGMTSNQLGYPPSQNQMWILVLVVLSTDASVSLNFSLIKESGIPPPLLTF